MAGPKVLAIVVAHASRTRVRETLRSLAAQTFLDMRIVVAAIGNLTVPEDTGVVADVVLGPDGGNFVEAANAVLAQPFAQEAEFVLFLHDDVSLEPHVIDELVRTAEADPTVVAVGPKLVEWENPEILQEVGAAIDRFAIRRTALDAGEVDAGQRDDTSDVLFCSDACLLVRRDALAAVGGLDPSSWPFYEDVDLCWRLRAQGARVVVAPGARVRHAADLSRGRRLFDTMQLRQHAERGRLRFLFKHYAPMGLIVLLPQLFIVSLARLVAAVVRRELWRARLVMGGWWGVVRDLRSIRRQRRAAGKPRVTDRELLQLSARGAAGDVRGERAETVSRFFASIGRVGERWIVVVREPVTWATAGAAVVVLLIVRHALVGGTFSLGELRPLQTFGDAMADHFGRVRREGLDPFAPGTPGVIVLGIVRSLAVNAAFAEKLVLLAPIWFAGVGGARLGGALGFGRAGRRWLGVLAATNPVTLSLLVDGALGALMLWTACLWLVGPLLTPVSPFGRGDRRGTRPDRVRFVARWAFGWAIVVALHPQAFVWLVVLCVVVAVARRGDNHTQDRIRILLSGSTGSFVLLAPWSFEWLTRRSPLVARPGWLVQEIGGGLSHATLGAGWTLLGWAVIAVCALYLVGVTRTSLGLATLLAGALLAAAAGVMSRETMLAGGGAAALIIVAIAARRIVGDLHRYELGPRHAAVIAGAVAIGVLWLGAVVQTVPAGARVRTLPIIAGERRSETGRVLWLAQTTGGLRSWSTLSFSERLGGFPEPGGPSERLVTRAIEAARSGRTHRLGSLLALADVSHIVALDDASIHGLDAQADIANAEQQGTATVFRNDAWLGAAMTLSGPPTKPLSPHGLATVVRRARGVRLFGWPYGPIRVAAPSGRTSGVLYVATGPRGGARFDRVRAHLAAAGAYVPLDDVRTSTHISIPGRWWHYTLPVEAALVIALLGAWLIAAYAAAPSPLAPEVAQEATSQGFTALALVAPLAIAAALVLGWSGYAWGVGTPLLSSAWYCPPVGEGFHQAIGIVNPNAADVQFQVRPTLRAAPRRAARIPGYGRATFNVVPTEGAVVESYGRRLAVASHVERDHHHDTALCAQETREENVFPEGGRFATRAIPRLFERYVIYNPFPELARASVRFLSPNETIAPPPLQDVRIPAGAAVLVNPEEQFEPMLDLSATIRVWQGRAIVSRRLRTVEQVSWSLPSKPITSGVLPRASTDNAVTMILGVNDGEDPVQVKLSGAGRSGSLPSERFEIPGNRRASFQINNMAPRASSLVINVGSERPVFLESLVAPDNRKTVSLMPPVDPQRRWVAPFAEARSLVVINPGARTVRVEMRRLGEGGGVRHFDVGANRTTTIRLDDSGHFGVMVSSSGPVTAAVVGPFGSTPGIPIL